MSNIRTRFAPSPTGFLHIGGVRTALYAYLFTKRENGTFILRIEDTDTERLVKGATEMIIKTLNDTGLHYDEGPEKGGGYGPYIQSERKALYAQYAEELIAKDGAYYCFCSKERLDQLKEHQTQHKLAFKYDGHCRNLSKDDIEKQKNQNTVYVVRQKTPQTGTTSFTDEVYGTITVNNIDLDDGVLMKSNGLPTYNFANVVDDHLMEITHVIRGSEFLSSTPKFQALYFAFGWKSPVYIHLPPIMKNARQKLSKRDGDASFYDLLNRGYIKEAVLNYIVLLGWNPGTTQEIFSMEELKKIFSVKGINKAPAIFDVEKLNWMNGEYIKRMSENEFHERALPFYQQSLKSDIDLKALSHVIHERTKKFTDIPEMIDFFDALPEYDTSLYAHKKMKTTASSSLEMLQNIKPVIEGIESWTQENIHNALFAYIQDKKLKNGQALWPLRTALSGKQFTPGGGIEIAYLLGKKETLSRIDTGIQKLSK